MLLLHQWPRCCLSDQIHQYCLSHQLNQSDQVHLPRRPVIRLDQLLPSDHLDLLYQ